MSIGNLMLLPAHLEALFIAVFSDHSEARFKICFLCETCLRYHFLRKIDDK